MDTRDIFNKAMMFFKKRLNINGYYPKFKLSIIKVIFSILHFDYQKVIIMSLNKIAVRNRPIVLSVFSMALLAMSGAQTASAGITENIENALKFGQEDAKYGQIKFNLRYRYEQDDSTNPAKEKGDASTIRLRIGYLTPEFSGFQGFVEYEGNQDVGANTYNSTRNGKVGFETIADPQEHELNQLWVSFKGIPDTEIKVGRQRIKIDNDRFIGNVGFRQLESTYDAILLTNKALSNTTVKLGYINQRQFITSVVQPMQTPFANVSYNFKGYGKLTGYSYLIDNNENHAQSNQSYGFSFAGKPSVTDDVKAVYRFEYAYQEDYEQNPNKYEADYFHFFGGASAFGVTAKGGIEQLGGKGRGRAFQTPLATGHAFHGWSDQFLRTPDQGLRDLYGVIVAKVDGYKFLARYHDYTDDTGNIEFGNELEFLVAKTFAKHYSLIAEYAYFDGDSGRPDVQNFWLQAVVKF